MTTNNLPRVAVLLAAYNGMQWIEEQVSSILNQQNVDVSLFVSVDLSTDGTEHWVCDLIEKHDNVVMLPYGQRHGSAAANFFHLIRAIDYSHFDYISLSDQDDIWLPNKVFHAIGEIKRRGVAAYSSDVMAFWPDGRKALLKKSYRETKYDHFFESPGPGCTYVLSADMLKDFCDKYSSFESFASKLTTNHDWFLYAYARCNGFGWYIDSHISMFYRQHAVNEVGMNKGIKAYLNRLKLVRSKWYRKQVELMFDSFSPERKSKILSNKYLICNFYAMRRRPRDKLAFLLILALRLF